MKETGLNGSMEADACRARASFMAKADDIRDDFSLLTLFKQFKEFSYSAVMAMEPCYGTLGAITAKNISKDGTYK